MAFCRDVHRFFVASYDFFDVGKARGVGEGDSDVQAIGKIKGKITPATVTALDILGLAGARHSM